MQPDLKPEDSKPGDFKLRVSVLGLILNAGDALLIHQMAPPEIDRWDLPGGGLEPHEKLMEGLAREVQEETGLIEFQVESLLTIVETFMQRHQGGTQHQLNIIYQCSVPYRPDALHSDELEVGEKGIQWLPISSLTCEACTTRAWKALQVAGLLNLPGKISTR
ncbi:MAG: NUDIX domain-containing protein [Leptolyngbyaceae cyanobacterium CRU_2_3]|nr:NUDIX domain-containing protein [Leptolyngbyaceae cyanobacterium CRU_2_3]